MLIAQISDCHILDRGERFVDRIDSAAGLRAAVATINALDPLPDLVLATGDLVDAGTASQYDHLVELLTPLTVPVLPIPGNHDDRTELRRRFASLPDGAPDDPIDHVVDDHDVRIVALDTTIPGDHAGRLSAAQCAWLDAELGSSPDHPTIVVQHHPPVPSGITWMDATCGFDDGGEAAVIARHQHVEAILSGHLHRAFHRRYAGTISVTWPSTACQLDLALAGGAPRYTAEPTGMLLHDWRDGLGLTTHVVPIGRHDRWLPTWT